MNNKGITIINTVLTVVLLAAVIYLLSVKNNNTADNGTAEKANTEQKAIENESAANQEPVTGETGLKIVYVNTDSLWDQYEFVKNTLHELEKEGKRLETSYKAKMTKLQNDYIDYQQNGSMLSLQQQKDREADMLKQQEEIKKLEEEVQNKLIIRKQKLNNQINDTILAFLNRYRVEKGYDLILQYAYLNSILSATPKIDVTKDVIEKINAEYKEFNK